MKTVNQVLMKVIVMSVLGSFAMLALAQKVQFEAALGNPVILAGSQQNAYLKVALTGFELGSETERAPVNIAIVLDKSGSMQGEKLQQAKAAAIAAIRRLEAQDIASVITYNHTVSVVVPATKVSDQRLFERKISRIRADGKTALFAGVSRGAGEVHKFLSRQRVNRVILLSDGLANVGPSSPTELARLGLSLAKEGISVSTIGLGLGYNEDLMTQLAGMSDGNHAFVESADDLAGIFDAEFGDVLSVVAQQLDLRIHCAPGIRPVRVIGRDAIIDGQNVRINLNQLYSEQEKFVVLEVALPVGEEGDTQRVADIDIVYFNTLSQRTEQLQGAVNVAYSASTASVEEAVDDEVMSDTVQQIANEMSKEAVQLRDAGKIKEAKRKLEESAVYLERSARRYNAPALQLQSEDYRQDADAVAEPEAWNRTRKRLRQEQYSVEKQQRF